MSGFKDRLWSELVRAHGADLDQMTRPAARSSRRPQLLAGTGLGVAVAAGTAAALVLGTAGTVPAFAVTQNHDGSVTVSISRIVGIPAANARLAALGYRARVVQVTAGCGANWSWARLRGAPPPGPGRQIIRGARFDPRQVPAGRLVVIPAWRSRGTVTVSRAQVMQGQVPACLPPPTGRLGAFREACCPPPVPTGRPGRLGQVLARPGRQVLAGPCMIRRGQRPLHISAHPPTRSPGGRGLPTQVTISCPAPGHVRTTTRWVTHN